VTAPKERHTLKTVLEDLSALQALRITSLRAQTLHGDISLPQLHILSTLEAGGPMTVSALAHLFSVSLPSASSILDRLEDRGYVERSRTDSDRRVVTVEITAPGRSLVAEFTGLKRDEMVRIMAAMTDQEVNDFTTGIAALRTAVERCASQKSVAATTRQ
jgi:DNA-binding MarR family transcriptional regulator